MDEGWDQELDTLVRTIPEGWSRAEIAGQAWGVTRTTHAGGKVISLNAERLSDTEQLGANVWITSEGLVLRPCEVPAEKVMRFLRAAAKVYTD
ncbi:peptide methionine sulfoxide reductase [Nonomuraea terrae]|uniref:Peptide methionine sulfoxide reductase n=1 Tax=Nonomuraea terrae TaxID=2530383 RepID=A0A4R4Z5T5_9ACTN|nr:peptide methionine sulfoxide reductase [Nonomuraea terrae]TDD53488.1 peptide methionine sulfoxide reductase [Nonomuraea terrae]